MAQSAQKFRNLQLYRNGEVILRPKEAVKEIIEGKFNSEEIKLRDGEPIFVRYSESQRADVHPSPSQEVGAIKGLLGIAYDFEDSNGRHRGIQWIDDGNVNIETEDDGYVELTYSESNGTYTILASANIARLDEVNCDSCYLKIVSLPTNAAYTKYNGVNYRIGESISIDCRGFEGKFYFYDSGNDDLGIDVAVIVVNGTIEYRTPQPEGFELQFIEGGDGLASACDVKSHIEYYNVKSELDGQNSPIEVTAVSDEDENGFNVTEFNVTLKVSGEQSNNLTILEDGSLYVATADAIADVRNRQIDCELGEEGQTYYYAWIGNTYVRVKPTNTPGTWLRTDNNQYWQGKVSNGVECGHRYLTIRTTNDSIFMVQNDADLEDTYVNGLTIVTDSGVKKLRLTQTNDTSFDVSMNDITDALRQAVVYLDTDSDNLSVTTSGILTTTAIDRIEYYIDNYDCGTF